MLRHLDIRDMLIIDRLELAFQPGLNVLTGETGAGKSILLDALGFALGWRGRADLVRAGAAQGEVVAAFHLSPDHPALALLAEAGLPATQEVILRRVNMPDGRKMAWINDRRAGGEVLRALSETLVELHGQQDDRGLLDPRQHRAMLDAFAGHEALLGDLRARWTAQRAAQKALEAAEAELARMQAEEDFLRHAVAELDQLDPQPGEEDALDARRRLMQAGAKMRDDLARADAALGLQGAEGAMGDARRWLDAIALRAEGGLDDALAALERALVELCEAQSALARFGDTLDLDPLALERTEERLFALRGLARKHGVAPDDLAGLADDLRARLAALDGGAGQIAGLAAKARAAAKDYADLAATLTQARRAAAARLDAAMAGELAPLRMERAVFTTRLEPAPAGPDGVDSVTFVAATNPGAPSGPLNKIASGGELSRFLLALKVCLTAQTRGVTMIFDEIDRGVGGATADAVGRRLKALAEGAQVLVVTHSPQVAALGAHHWQVAKRVVDDQTFSHVSALDPAQRIDEVARMLAGEEITPAAREAARALIGAA
jgi:DNA repair protein RecN (Recombination protein N)